MKKSVAVILGAVMLFSAWLIYSKHAERRREAAYAAAMAPLQHDLRFGMTRADVDRYLHSTGTYYSWINFGHAETYVIPIGEEPGTLVCKPWKVYVALEFEPADKTKGARARSELDPSDKLKDVHIKKMGTCL